MNGSEEDAGLLEIITDAARLGDVCPGTGKLARILGVTSWAVQLGLDRLRRAGLIEWRVAWCGDVRGKVRVVTLLATGESTGEPEPSHRERPVDPALDEAKTRLRRKGHIVYDAEISDGPRGRGLVRVDHRRLSREAVLELAGVIPAGVVPAGADS